MIRKLTTALLFVMACVAPEAENLGEGRVPGELDEPCDPDAETPCVDGARCSFVIDETVEWYCTPHGTSVRSGDRCTVQEDCGPQLQCCAPLWQRYCAPFDGEVDLAQPCLENAECPDDWSCVNPPQPEETCAPRCIDDTDCPTGQVCHSHSLQWGGAIVPDVFSACLDAD